MKTVGKIKCSPRLIIPAAKMKPSEIAIVKRVHNGISEELEGTILMRGPESAENVWINLSRLGPLGRWVGAPDVEVEILPPGTVIELEVIE